MDQNEYKRMMKEYDENFWLYSEYTTKLESLLKEILRSSDIKVHSVSSRCKDRDSFSVKTLSPDSKYIKLSDITDIAGIRIITYFEDEVDKVAHIIEKEFKIDKQNSSDKRAILDPDRFGYLSLHYVVELGDNRLRLVEYQRYPKLKAEIQIRSILQHAWAEIEHDLGYKSNLAVPKSIRRQFSQLAGLLELADKQFVNIKESLHKYENSVGKEILESPEKVEINLASISAFISGNKILREIDQEIATEIGATLAEMKDQFVIDSQLVRLKFLKIHTIDELEKALKENSHKIARFAISWLSGDKYRTINKSICLLYLAYVLVAKSNDLNYIVEFLNVSNIGKSQEREDTGKEIIKTYWDISKE
jgi:putative GTP pyrophosphokinase